MGAQSNRYENKHYSLKRAAPKYPSYSKNKNNHFNDNPSNHHSSYSCLHPTNNKEHEMDNFIDPNKETLIFDIDGTIADIEQRLAMAPGTKSDGTRTPQEWNIVLDGNNYRYDRVIPAAWAYLKHIESMNKFNILYLSGRRAKSIKQSMTWLFEQHSYPKGFVIHRFKGMSGQQFKQQQLIKLQSKLKIAGYFGDRIIDDCIVSIKAGVRSLLVLPNEWLFAKHIYGGIGAVICDIIQNNEYMINKCKQNGEIHAAQYWQNKNIPQAFIEIAKQSEFWDMPYDDLVPLEFATELFDNGNMELLPPECLLKIKQSDDEYYWNKIIKESKKILSSHGNDKNENEEAVRQFIESSDSENNECESLGSRLTQRIKFCYDQQSNIQPKHRWLPVGQHN